MQKLYVVLLSFLAFLNLAEATDYCSPEICSHGAIHIACNHSGEFDARCPPDATMVKLDGTMRNSLVRLHNEKRNLVAGGSVYKHGAACRMATMKWDKELASLAAFNVLQCEMQHDKCHNTDDFKFSGQNLAYMSFYGNPDNHELLAKAVDLWYEEVIHCKPSQIDNFPKNYIGPVIGHFTVMVADRNTHLGCAASHFSVPGAPYRAYLVACNYATTNIINYPIYTKCQEPGSDCAHGRNPLYPNLCANAEPYEVNTFKRPLVVRQCPIDSVLHMIFNVINSFLSIVGIK